MTIKETKQWLRRVWKAESEIRLKREELERIEASATRITASLSGMPGSPSSDPHHKIENAAIRAAELRADVDSLEALKAEVQRVINKLNHPQHRTVLTLRNIQCLQWSRIQKLMGYSYPGIQHLYSRALNELSEMLK